MTEWGDARPPYLRIAQEVRARIESGQIPPGEPIPSVNALMAEFGVANTTVQRALRSLRAAGLVEPRAGKGTFVRERPKRTTRSVPYLAPPGEDDPLPYVGKSTEITVAEIEPPDEVAEEMGIDVGELALRRRRVIVENDEPVEIVTSYYPLDLARGTKLAVERGIKGGAHAELKRMGVEFRDAEETVSAWMPTADEARTLRLPPSTPVMHLLRTVFDVDGRRVEVEHSVYGADRYQFRYRLPLHE
jgi:GntR family transcriptional regulator